MRKLKLEIDELTVESFAILPHSSAKEGTVQGLVGEWQPIFVGPTEGTCIGPTYCCAETWRPTCEFTCDDWTCGYTICQRGCPVIA